jgi:hypothetical protein
MWKTQLTLDTGIREAGIELQKINLFACSYIDHQ